METALLIIYCIGIGLTLGCLVGKDEFQDGEGFPAPAIAASIFWPPFLLFFIPFSMGKWIAKEWKNSKGNVIGSFIAGGMLLIFFSLLFWSF